MRVLEDTICRGRAARAPVGTAVSRQMLMNAHEWTIVCCCGEGTQTVLKRHSKCRFNTHGGSHGPPSLGSQGNSISRNAMPKPCLERSGRGYRRQRRRLSEPSVTKPRRLPSESASSSAPFDSLRICAGALQCASRLPVLSHSDPRADSLSLEHKRSVPHSAATARPPTL